MATLLEMAQQFCARQLLPKPSSVVSTTDDTVRQILALFNESVVNTSYQFAWPQMRLTKTFANKGYPDYGALNIPMDFGDFRGIINGTFYDKSSLDYVHGPLDDQEWAYTVTRGSGVSPCYNLSGGFLRIYPQITTPGQLYTLRYLTSFPVIGGDGTTGKASFTDDADSTRIPSHVVVADIRWRWKKEKGEPYAMEKAEFDSIVRDALAVDGSARGIDLAGEPMRPEPFPFASRTY